MDDNLRKVYEIYPKALDCQVLLMEVRECEVEVYCMSYIRVYHGSVSHSKCLLACFGKMFTQKELLEIVKLHFSFVYNLGTSSLHLAVMTLSVKTFIAL